MNTKDTFYWPDMEKSEVLRSIDISTNLPSCCQPYTIPEFFKSSREESSTPTDYDWRGIVHNHAIYSMWSHFLKNMKPMHNPAVSSTRMTALERIHAPCTANCDVYGDEDDEYSCRNREVNWAIPSINRLQVFVTLACQGTLAHALQHEVQTSATFAITDSSMWSDLSETDDVTKRISTIGDADTKHTEIDGRIEDNDANVPPLYIGSPNAQYPSKNSKQKETEEQVLSSLMLPSPSPSPPSHLISQDHEAALVKATESLVIGTHDEKTAHTSGEATDWLDACRAGLKSRKAEHHSEYDMKYKDGPSSQSSWQLIRGKPNAKYMKPRMLEARKVEPQGGQAGQASHADQPLSVQDTLDRVDQLFMTGAPVASRSFTFQPHYLGSCIGPDWFSEDALIEPAIRRYTSTEKELITLTGQAGQAGQPGQASHSLTSQTEKTVSGGSKVHGAGQGVS